MTAQKRPTASRPQRAVAAPGRSSAQRLVPSNSPWAPPQPSLEQVNKYSMNLLRPLPSLNPAVSISGDPPLQEPQTNVPSPTRRGVGSCTYSRLWECTNKARVTTSGWEVIWDSLLTAQHERMAHFRNSILSPVTLFLTFQGLSKIKIAKSLKLITVNLVVVCLSMKF